MSSWTWTCTICNISITVPWFSMTFEAIFHEVNTQTVGEPMVPFRCRLLLQTTPFCCNNRTSGVGLVRGWGFLCLLTPAVMSFIKHFLQYHVRAWWAWHIGCCFGWSMEGYEILWTHLHICSHVQCTHVYCIHIYIYTYHFWLKHFHICRYTRTDVYVEYIGDWLYPFCLQKTLRQWWAPGPRKEVTKITIRVKADEKKLLGLRWPENEPGGKVLKGWKGKGHKT